MHTAPKKKARHAAGLEDRAPGRNCVEHARLRDCSSAVARHVARASDVGNVWGLSTAAALGRCADGRDHTVRIADSYDGAVGWPRQARTNRVAN